MGLVIKKEYDPNRNCKILLIEYSDGEKKYILEINGLQLGKTIISNTKTLIELGNSLPLTNIPIGTEIHNIEFQFQMIKIYFIIKIL